MSGHFCNRRLFSNFSFSALCSKNFEVMKLAATRYDETNVDIHPFLILNMEKPKILSGIFFGDNKNSLYKLFLLLLFIITIIIAIIIIIIIIINIITYMWTRYPAKIKCPVLSKENVRNF